MSGKGKSVKELMPKVLTEHPFIQCPHCGKLIDITATVHKEIASRKPK
jgi:hypothetical protein